MSKNIFETLIGALVLVIAFGFAVFAYQSSNLRPVEGYSVKARFASVDGLAPGSDVRIGGIKVGVVSGMDLDSKTYEAMITLQLRENIELPTDTNAAVVSTGLLGNKFVELAPGGDEEMLKEGDEITFTQSSVNFETLLGKMVHSGGGVDEEPTGDLTEVIPDTNAAETGSEAPDTESSDAGPPTLE